MLLNACCSHSATLTATQRQMTRTTAFGLLLMRGEYNNKTEATRMIELLLHPEMERAIHKPYRLSAISMCSMQEFHVIVTSLLACESARYAYPYILSSQK